MADAKFINRERVLAKLRGVPDVVLAAAQAQLQAEVDGLTEAIKRAAPVDEHAERPGELRDSVHSYPNPDRPLSFRIIADARDPHTANFIGPHVEAGHRAVDGTHVAARPFFFPTYRARKKGMRRRMNAAARKAIKALFPGG